MKQHLRLAAAAAILLAATASQAQDSGPRKKTPARGDAVIVKGCVSGPTVQSTETVTADDTGLLSALLTYQLKGDKQLLKQLRDEHDGERVEVSGILRSTLPQDSSIRGKSLGKTKVVLGVGTPSAQRGVTEPGPSLPVLEVRSFAAPGTRCASR